MRSILTAAKKARARRRRRRETARQALHIEALEPRRLLAVEVLQPPPDLELREDFAEQVIDLSDVFIGDPNSPLQIAAESSDPDLAEISVLGDVLQLTSLDNRFGEAQVTITASDGSGVDGLVSLALTVAAVNDPPRPTGADMEARTLRVAEGSQPLQLDLAPWFDDVEHQPLEFDVQVLSASDAGDPVAAAEVEGSLLTVTLDDNHFGYSQLAVTASDGQAQAATTLWLLVDPVDDAPQGQLEDRQFAGQVDAWGGWPGHSPVQVDLWKHFDDAEDGPYLQYEVHLSGGAALAADPVIDEHDILHYQPASDPGLQATTTISVSATDRAGQTVVAEFQVQVSNPPAPPGREVVYHYDPLAGMACTVVDNGADDDNQATLPTAADQGPVPSGETSAAASGDSSDPAATGQPPASEPPDDPGDGDPGGAPSGDDDGGVGAGDDPDAGSSGAGDLGAGDPGTGELEVPDPGAGDPGADDPGAGDPDTGDPDTGDPDTGGTGSDPGPGTGTGDSGGGLPGTGGADDPGTGDSSTGDSSTGDSSTGDSGTGDSGTGDAGNGIDSGSGDAGGDPGNEEPGSGDSGNAEPGSGDPGGDEPGGCYALDAEGLPVHLESCEPASPPPTVECEEIDEEITWTTTLRWEDPVAGESLSHGTGGMVVLNDNFDEGNQQAVATWLSRAEEHIAGLGDYSGDDEPGEPGDETGEGDVLLSLVEPRRDNEPDRFDTRVHGIHNAPQQAELRPVSFQVQADSNLPFARQVSGTLTWDFPEQLRLWRNHHGRWVPVEPGGAYDIGVRLMPGWEPIEMPVPDGRTHLKAVGEATGQAAQWLMVEGTMLGQGQITATFQTQTIADVRGDGSTAGSSPIDFQSTEQLAADVVRVDLDVDSDNDGAVEAADEDEDRLEDDADRPGKLLVSSAADADHDGIVDTRDGFDADGVWGTDDDQVTAAQSAFAPLLITVPETLDLAAAQFRFHYAAADPADESEGDAGGGAESEGQEPGKLRIWTADQLSPRSAFRANDPQDAGHFVSASHWDPQQQRLVCGVGPCDAELEEQNVYSWEQLTGLPPGEAPRQAALYVEGLHSGRYQIGITVDADGAGTLLDDGSRRDLFAGFGLRDFVRVTVTDEVAIHAADRFAQETPGGAPVDTAQFVVSRGEFNTHGELTVFFQVGEGSGADAGLDDYVAHYEVGPDQKIPWQTGYDDQPRSAEHTPLVPEGQLPADAASRIGSVTIPDGQSQAVIDVTVRDDLSPEWDETLQIEVIAWHEYAAAHNLPPLTSPADGLLADPAPYQVAADGRSAAVTILDNDRLSAASTRNWDAASTGEQPLTVGNHLVDVGVADGQLSLAMPLGGLRYRDNDNLLPIVEATLTLPLDEQHPAADISGLKAQLTFAGLAAAPVEFPIDAVKEFFNDPIDVLARINAERPIRLVVLGPSDLSSQLPTGHYDYDVVVEFDFDGRRVTRTLRGSTEVVNRVDARFGQAELGQRWVAEGADRLWAGDEITPPGRAAAGDLAENAVSRLGAQGARNEFGAALVRGDNSSAWFAAEIAGAPQILEIDQASEDPDAAVRLSDGDQWQIVEGPDDAYRVSSAGLRQRQAAVIWRLDDLSLERPYQLFVSWAPGKARASNAAYQVRGARPVGGAEATTDILVDQRFQPGETRYDDRRWRSLGYFLPVPAEEGSDHGVIEVSLSTAASDGQFADGSVAAGPLMLVNDWQFQTPDGSFGRLSYEDLDATDQWHVDAQYTPAAGHYTWIGKHGGRAEFAADGLLARRVDRNGNRVELGYIDADGDGLRDDLQTITEQGGLTTTLAYDAGGAIQSVTDFAGAAHQLDVVAGQVRSVSLPSPDPASGAAAAALQFAYLGPGGRLSQVVDGEGHVTEIRHSALNGRVAAVVNPDSPQHEWTLVAQRTDGLPQTENGPGAVRLAPLRYEPLLSAPLPQPAARYVDARGGADPAAPAWLYQTDALGLMTIQQPPPTDSRPQEDVWQWTRNRHGQIEMVVSPQGGGGAGNFDRKLSLYRYDSSYDLRAITHFDNSREHWTYDGDFHVPLTYTDQLGHMTQFRLDERGNVTELIEPVDAGTQRHTLRTFTAAPESVDQLPGGLVAATTEAAGSAGETASTIDYYTSGLAVGLPHRKTQAAGSPLLTVREFHYDQRGNLRTSFIVGEGPGTEYFYNQLDQLVRIVEPDPGSGQHAAPTTHFRYDQSGNLVRETLPHGWSREYVYDGMNRLVLTLPLSHPDFAQVADAAVEYQYDGAGNRIREIVHRDGDWSGESPQDQVTIKQYDARNLLQSVRQPAPVYPALSDVPPPPDLAVQGPHFEYRYDALGHLRLESDALGLTGREAAATLYYYDAESRLVKTQLPEAEGEIRDQVTRVYDQAGQLLRLYEPTGGGTARTSFTYDALGRTVEVEHPLDGSGRRLLRRTTWNLLDQEIAVEQLEARLHEAPIATGVVTRRVFDDLGRLTAVDHPDPSEDAAGLVTMYAYNAAGDTLRTLVRPGELRAEDLLPGGNLTAEQLDLLFANLQAAGEPVQMEVSVPDRLGRVISVRQAEADDLQTHFVYDVLGRLILDETRFMEQGVQKSLNTVRSYDPASRMTAVVGPGPAPGEGPSQTWEFNLDGTVKAEHVGNAAPGVSTAEPWQTTRYVYDSLGRRHATFSPEIPAPTVEYHDPRGLLIYQSGQGIGVQRMQYDQRGRLSSQQTDAGSMRYEYYPDNSLFMRTDESDGSSVAYLYDQLGNVVRESATQSGQQSAKQYSYDLLGRLVSVTDPLGTVTELEYDRVGNQKADRLLTDDGPLERTYRYDAFGNRVQQVDRRGRAIQWEYDPQGRPTAERWYGSEGLGQIPAWIDAASGIDVTREELLAYNALGELTGAEVSEVDSATGNPSQSRVDFAYDALRRVDQVLQHWDDTAEFDFLLDYEYDLAGNLLSRAAHSQGETLISDIFQVDTLGRVTEAAQQGPAATDKRVEFRYLAAASAENLEHGIQVDRFGAHFNADVTTHIGRRGDGRATYVRHNGGDGRRISEVLLQYDYQGRVAHEARRVADRVEYDYEREYRYNYQDQLVSETEPGPQRRYDAAGNRLGLIDEQHRLIEDRSSRYAYDAEGNVIHQVRFAAVQEAELTDDEDETSLGSAELLTGLYRLWLDQVRLDVADEDAEVSVQLWADGTVLVDDPPPDGALAAADGFFMAVDFAISQNVSVEQLRLVFVDRHGQELPAVSGLAQVGRATHYQFEYNHRNQLTEAVERVAGPASDIHAVSRWRYDALGNLIAHRRDEFNDGSWDVDRRMVPAEGRTLLELNGQGELVRHRMLTPAGELLAVENVSRTESGWSPEGVIWTLPDHQGSIRDLMTGDRHAVHLQYDAFGRPLEPIYVEAPTSPWDSVTARFGQFEFDTYTGLYLSQGRPYEPLSGRYLTSVAEPGENGYLFAGNAPVNPQVMRQERPVAQAPPSLLLESAASFAYYVHPLHNPPGVWGTVAGAFKVAGWTAYLIGSAGSGAAATGASMAAAEQSVLAAIRAGAARYLLRQAVFTAAETGVAFGLHAQFGNGEPFPWRERLALSFVANSASGFMFVRGGRTIDRAAALLGRQTIELALKTGYDVAQGKDFAQTVGANALSGVVGELAARVLRSALPVTGRMALRLLPQRHATPAAYAGVRRASRYLRMLGVPRPVRKRILESFDRRALRIRTAGAAEYRFRVFNHQFDGSAGSPLGLLYDTLPATRRGLSLLPELRVKQFRIRRGAVILEGPPAPLGPWRPRGALQSYVREDDLLEL